jgi:hypothetical protein
MSSAGRTVSSGSTLTVNTGDTITVYVFASDQNTTDVVTISASGEPLSLGATFTGAPGNGTMYTPYAMNVDTKIISALFNRILNKETFDIMDPTKVPLGLHPNYPKSIAPKWQRP